MVVSTVSTFWIDTDLRSSLNEDYNLKDMVNI